jgi:3-methyladenine DNA glycosylase AlkD
VDVSTVVASIESDLREVSTPERAAGSKQYLKSDLDFLGATVPDIRKVAKRVRRAHPDLDHDSVMALAAALWESTVFELRMSAVEILCLHLPVLEAGDLPTIEAMLRASKTWALVDVLASTVVGNLITRFPDLNDELDRWATDDDFWIRRSALLAHLKPLREGGDFTRFSRYADSMLEEKEFFIRKAIGWVLRDMSRNRPEVVAAWVGPRTHRVSGVTIREAVKKLPPQQAESLMEAYREKRPATG